MIPNGVAFVKIPLGTSAYNVLIHTDMSKMLILVIPLFSMANADAMMLSIISNTLIFLHLLLMIIIAQNLVRISQVLALTMETRALKLVCKHVLMMPLPNMDSLLPMMFQLNVLQNVLPQIHTVMTIIMILSIKSV